MARDSRKPTTAARVGCRRSFAAGKDAPEVETPEDGMPEDGAPEGKAGEGSGAARTTETGDTSCVTDGEGLALASTGLRDPGTSAA